MENTKENQFSVPKKYVMKEKKNCTENNWYSGGYGKQKTTLLIFNSCLNRQIIYCLSEVQITLNKGLLYCVLKISLNMPAETVSTFYC